MRYLRAENPDRQTVLGTKIGLADNWWRRFVGLSGRKSLDPGEGLWLRPCRAVHMYGMSLTLDVAFLDRSGRVVAVYAELRPGRRTRWHSSARDALELPAGTLAASRTKEGDTIVCTEEGF